MEIISILLKIEKNFVKPNLNFYLIFIKIFIKKTGKKILNYCVLLDEMLFRQ